jgi:CBS domain-containing protein
MEPDTLYSGELRRRGERMHVRSESEAIAELRVIDVMQPTRPIHAAAAVEEVLTSWAEAGLRDIPVVDQREQLVGIVSIADFFRLTAQEREIRARMCVADIAVPVEAVLPQDSLLSVIQKLRNTSTAALPVLDPASGSIIGMVTHTQVLDAVGRQLSGSAADVKP